MQAVSLSVRDCLKSFSALQESKKLEVRHLLRIHKCSGELAYTAAACKLNTEWILGKKRGRRDRVFLAFRLDAFIAPILDAAKEAIDELEPAK
jgi:hypothetical protein